MDTTSSSTHEFYDLIIVGAGLVGSAMACALASSPEGAHLRIAVVEAGGDPAQFSGTDFDPRVVALTHASRSLLEQVDVWHDIVAQRVCPYTDMDVWDAEGTGQIHFDCREVQQLSLGHIVENSVVTRALLSRIDLLDAIDLLRPAKVLNVQYDEQREVRLVNLEDGRELHAPLVIAADGANSPIRQMAGLHTREWSYGHSAIVTTVKTELSHQFTAWQRFLPTGPLAFLPLQSDAGNACSNYSSIVWSIEDQLVDELMSLDDKAFRKALADAFEYRLGDIVDVAKRYSFPLRQRHATDYVDRGLALVGDAAHTIHPLAGQGVNLGFLDVAVLTEEILRGCERQLPLSEHSILKRYQRRRKSHNLSMMAIMEAFKRLFGTRDLPVRWLRNEGMRQLNGLAPLKNAIVRQAMGL
ncbi:UbiH/UbiF/VisC/COQ6 family ubiquinone biosynthesis hydroxylase [Pseudomaricurvus alkylphenolicus]|uniref:UbiH/UbiF/VisC/COQ6 family ubiquinone biosynthesis hydroxylase n=1 Tax=Pseudomaricurvus alkylphenolicus TaxID=1306991 RepID=UPI00141F2D5E|nr:UbiH/UbiF/VisC/COQ6 family ubiquinone biosynthesis hydroxylase [Pseudomaricurvus alkylphenolicus]NIB39644.1 UbiH/UbiF/VisC/COQ6 family ubiquinone biosynthesis hydroxylase [Pseudomaricurvus alkylphenolicus]